MTLVLPNRFTNLVLTLSQKILQYSSVFQNNKELFVIHNISTNLSIPMYQIKSIDNPEEDVIKGQFYGHELTMYSKE